jgi:hypothetical protein
VGNSPNLGKSTTARCQGYWDLTRSPRTSECPQNAVGGLCATTHREAQSRHAFSATRLQKSSSLVPWKEQEYANRAPLRRRSWSGLRKPQGRAGEMSRSFVQHLKRLEIRCGPTSKPREIVIEIVGPEKEVVRTFVLKGGRLECPKDHQHETDRKTPSPA